MMYYKKKEKKEHQLISENRDQAVLQIYGDPIRIDGKVFSEYEHMGSKLSYYTVVLPEGRLVQDAHVVPLPLGARPSPARLQGAVYEARTAKSFTHRPCL